MIILSSLKYGEKHENVLSCGDMVSESIIQKVYLNLGFIL